MSKRAPKLATLGSRVAVVPQRLQTVQPGSWRTSGQTSAQRGYGYRWQKERAAHLQEHPFCEYCMREAGIQATSIEAVILECAVQSIAVPYASVVDHKVPHRGDERLFWDRRNWQSLCATHHSSTKQREEAGYGDG